MKRLLIVLIVFTLSASVWAADSKETLELKLNALTWEFKSHQAEMQLRQFRMQSIKNEATKIEATLRELVKKDKPGAEAAKE